MKGKKTMADTTNTANTTVVLKADAALMAKLKTFYQDDFCPKTPQYAEFQAKCEDCTVTLYTSGKVMFQGKRAEEESAIWTGISGQAPLKSKANANTGTAMKNGAGSSETSAGSTIADFRDTTAIGSDEVGTGDFFGPVVVTASYVREEDFALLTDLGVRDSKKLTDEKILKIAPTLIEKIPHHTRILTNEEYNEMRGRGINMNQLKAILHNECLFEMKESTGCKLLVVDQFEPPKAYYNHLKDETRLADGITFMTKAEDKCLAVAVSSVISRYLFLQAMEEMATELGVDQVPLGAGAGVDAFGAELVRDQGQEILPKIAKLNFANLEKVKALV